MKSGRSIANTNAVVCCVDFLFFPRRVNTLVRRSHLEPEFVCVCKREILFPFFIFIPLTSSST